ncbi:hypothetical protein HD806DRAFT_542046 [Xylariaceae sp. AK1471]|nr:hypothetical protein HD806DRAFT_542046 [Xylariaceae sp. AK1471]
MDRQINERSLPYNGIPPILPAKKGEHHAPHNDQAETTIRALREEVKALKAGMDMMVADLFAEYDQARKSLEVECSERTQQVLDLTAKLQEYQEHQTQAANTLAELTDQYNQAHLAAREYRQRSEQAELRVQELEQQVTILHRQDKQRARELDKLQSEL